MNKRTDDNFRFQFGRLKKGINSLLLKENELSDCQNMIPGYQGWKQRKGSSALTTTSAIATSLRFKSLHQFRDLKDWTNVMVAHTYDSSNGERALKQSTLPPSTAAGSSWVEMYDFTANCEETQWATVAGTLIGANNKEFIIWRGEKHWPTGVWTYLDADADYISFFDEMVDGDDSTTMSLSSFTIGDYVHVMHDQPIDTISPDIGTVNATSAWMMAEYWKGTWSFLKAASWWATAEYLDEDCTGIIGTDWDDDDSNGESTNVTYEGRECFKLDSGGNAAYYAQISKDVGTLGDTFGFSFLVNFGAIPEISRGDYLHFSVDCGSGRLQGYVGDAGIYIYNGSTYSEAGATTVSAGEWNLYTIICDFTTPASATCDVYINGTQVETGFDCSDTGTATDGDVIFKQNGGFAINRIAYLTQILVGDSLDTTGHGFSDGTASSGVPLAQDGDISWTAAGDETRTIIDGQQGYAVRFAFSKGISANTSIEAMDIHTPMNTLRNIWDGITVNPTGAYTYDGTDFTDYTIYVNSPAETQYMDASGLGTSDKIYFGFADRVSRIRLSMASDGKNSNNVSISDIKYHDTTGTAVSVGTFVDTTETGTATLSQNGYLDWVPIADNLEKPIKLGGDDIPWYWYEVTVDASLDATTFIYFVEGVPIPEDLDYSFGCFGWKRRAWQVAPYNMENQVRYSAQNLPNTFNGLDSGYIEFGERPLRAAAPFYNETVIFADTEMWMLQGSSAQTFGRMRLSARIGCAAPHSVLSIETGVSIGDSIKNVVVWMFYDGIWLFDGVRIMKLSSPDIDTFFDPTHDDYINPTYLDQCYSTYDHESQCAFFTVYSGASATSPTKVLVLHFPTLWYGIVDYATDMGTIDSVWNNKYYLVGGGFATGYQYLLNTGTTDVNSSGTAVAVDAFVITRDMFTSYSGTMQGRLLSIWAETQTEGGLIEVDEYPDGSDTPQNIAKQNMRWLGKLFGRLQKPLKHWSQQKTAKFRIRNRSKNARMNLLGISTKTDKGPADE